MTGVPSIVMGLFIYTFWVLHFKEQTAFAGALALGCLMLPVVIRTTEEMLKLVPTDLREGSYALGSRRARTIRTVVLPHAAPGIVSGALLAVARAAGETAPLVFTIGIVTSTNWSPFKGTNTALSREIFRNAASPFQGAQDRVRRRPDLDPHRVLVHRTGTCRDRDLHAPILGRRLTMGVAVQDSIVAPARFGRVLTRPPAEAPADTQPRRRPMQSRGSSSSRCGISRCATTESRPCGASVSTSLLTRSRPSSDRRDVARRRCSAP